MVEQKRNRAATLLATIASIAFFGHLVGGALLLIAAPVGKVFAGDDPDWTWSVEVPAAVRDTEVPVQTSWGSARLVVEDVRGDLELPIGLIPWWFVAMLWTYAAIGFVLILLCLHHLRRIFQRVRDGAPFDAHNALRLRWLGLLVLALALFSGIAKFITALAVRRGLGSGNIGVPAELHIDFSSVALALVLVALAEVFRRGAELEHEQSLVV